MTDSMGAMAGRAPESGEEGSILAAGGLLELEASDGVRVAVVHRARYRDRDGSPGDHLLPKGKVEPGETLEQAALREVEEETGCRGRILGPSFSCEYRVGSLPKVVLFFRMRCTEQGLVRDPSEVREVLWLAPREALRRLTYESERAIVGQAYPDLSTGSDEQS